MNNKIFYIVKSGLEELNEELEYDSLKLINADSHIFGGEEGIDSLSLVRLIVWIERKIEEKFGRRVNLADEKAMSQRSSPYRNVRSLVNFIAIKLEDGCAKT